MEDRFMWRIWDKIHKRYIYCDFAGYCSVDYEGKGQRKIAFRASGVEQVLTHTANSIIYADEEEAIVEQCTGLKDINGKLIYEGDITKTVTKNETIFKVVEYRKENCCFVFRNVGTDISHHIEDDWLKDFPTEITGNIHENPELLR